ncbi:MAG: Sjogren's syndrome/scleroderma autoantigen 1 family protein [Candidatus Thorarchaeota archaeon]
MTDNKDAAVKKMAELLRHGATMLADACPQCGSPLLKVGEDIYCAKCDRRIVIVKSDEAVESYAVKALIPELRVTLLKKLKSLNDLIEHENDTESLTSLANLMLLLLQALYKIEGINDD